MELNGKACIVTAGASDLGKAICELLASHGLKIIICDIDATSGGLVSKLINYKYAPGTSAFMHCDVKDIDAFRACFEKAKSMFGRLDIVVNNSGICNDPSEKSGQDLDVELKGVMNGYVLSMEFMGKRNGGAGGVVINTSILKSMRPASEYPIYSATKWAVLGLRNLDLPLHYDTNGIRFLTICPSFSHCKMSAPIPNSEIKRELGKNRPACDYQSPQSIAKCVVEILMKGENGSVWQIQDERPDHLATIREDFVYAPPTNRPSPQAREHPKSISTRLRSPFSSPRFVFLPCPLG